METTLERYESIARNLGCSMRDLFGAINARAKPVRAATG